MRITVAIACLLLGATIPLGPGAALAQDEQPSAERPREQPVDAADRRRDARRAWLARRLEESRAEQARLENMLRKLDAGEPLPEFGRPPRRGRGDGGEGGEGGEGREGRERGADGGGRRGEQRADDPRDGRAMPLEERVRLVARFAREHFPEFAEQLESELQRDPAAAHRIAARFWPRVVELRELEKTEPELFAVEVERLRSGHTIMNSVRRARSAAPHDAAGRQRLIEHLRQLAERHFELRVEAVRLRLESLRQSVRETERELEERRADREQSVDRQVQRLLRIIDEKDGENGGGDGGGDESGLDSGRNPSRRGG